MVWELQNAWKWWAGFFDWMPYGDPYGATFAVLMLVVVGSCLMFGATRED